MPRSATHLAIVPHSLGLLVIDHDAGDPDNVRAFLRNAKVPFAEAQTVSGGVHFYVRCSHAMGNANWQLSTGEGGQIRAASGWVVIYDPGVIERALALQEYPGIADVIAGLTTARVAEGLRRDTHNAAVFHDPAKARARYYAAVADGHLPSRAHSIIAEAAKDGEALKRLQRAYSFTSSDLRGNPVIDEMRAAVVWRHAMEHYAETGVRPVYWITDRGRWIIWNGTRWTWADVSRTDTPQVRKLWSDLCADLERAKIIERDVQTVATSLAKQRAIVGCLQSLRTIKSAALDTAPELAGLPDGCALNVETGALLAPDHTRLITRALGCTPDGDVPTPRWDAFIGEAVPDHSCLAWLLGFMRYVLTGDTRFHVFLFVHGRPGTGKSTLGDTVRIMLGDYAAVLPGERLVKSRNEAHPEWITSFDGSRLVYVDEVPHGREWLTDKLQSAVSGERLKARDLYQSSFEFTSRAKVIVTGNDAPTADPNAGIWRRLAVLPMDREPERVDEGLRAALIGELPGIMAKVLQGDMSALANFPEPMRIAAAEQREDADVIGAGLEACGVFEEGASCRVTELRLALIAGGYLPQGLQNRACIAKLKGRRGVEVRRVHVDGGRHQVIQGYRLHVTPGVPAADLF